MDLFGRKARKEIAWLKGQIEQHEETIVALNKRLEESTDLVTKYSLAFNKIHDIFHELHDGIPADTDGDTIITEEELDKMAVEELAFQTITESQIESEIG